MGKINSITKQTDNRYVNLYNVKATSVHNTPVNYFVSSRAKDVDSLKMVTHKNNPDGVTIQPEHKLLITTDTESPNYYPYAVAGKTGYTSIAGQTLVTYAIKDDRRQIAVTMKSTQATHYQDTIALMDFGFLRFKNVNISENETAYTSGDQPVQIGDNSYQPSFYWCMDTPYFQCGFDSQY